MLQVASRQLPVGVAHEVRRGRDRSVDHRVRAALRHLGDGVGACRHHKVATDHQMRAAGVDAGRRQCFGLGGELDVRHDRAVFLREARHVQYRNALCFQVRGHGEDLADGDNAGTADAGHQHAVGRAERGQRRFRKRGEIIRHLCRRATFPELAAFDGDEARAEALETGEILVAGRLVDQPLAAELGLQRLDREAVRFHAAVAAAFAHRLVDDDPLCGIGIFIFLAAAALLGGAGLVVDQRRYPGSLAQLPLHGVQVVAVPDGDAGRPLRAVRIFLGLVGHDDDRLHPFGGDLT